MSNSIAQFSILVNTTDSYSDCWLPFFKLFKIYWPNYKGKIYLNTEKKDYNYSDLNIISIKSNLDPRMWSKRLAYALNYIEEKYILHMQEDYFLHSFVRTDLLESFFEKMVSYDLDCLHLTDQCGIGFYNENTGIKDVWEIKKGSRYRVATQSAFWKKHSLKKLLRIWENVWEFEKYGSMRSDYLFDKIMCVNQNIYGIGKIEILPYIFTGIQQGKWKKDVVDVFNKHGIEIDFNRRGFYSEIRRTLKNRIVSNLDINKQINRVKSIIDLKRLKVKSVRGYNGKDQIFNNNACI